GSDDGRLYAYATTCGKGGAVCTPIWGGPTGAPVKKPSVSGERVFATSRDGNVYAFSTSCGQGGSSCTPVWKGPLGGPSFTAPAITNDAVYATSDPAPGS